MYTHTYPPNEILVPNSHTDYKGYATTLFIRTGIVPYFFSFQCETEFLNKITILINMGLTLKKELTHLLILLLIKVRFQKKPPSLFFHGLDYYKPFSLRGCYRHGLKAKSDYIILSQSLLLYYLQFQLIILPQFDTIQ